MHESHYPIDALYPTRYFRELAPVWLNYVARLHGVPAPVPSRPFRYLELGCGTGLTSTVHAAVHPQAEFHLCDFNPLCLDAARNHAERLDCSNVTLHQGRFSELNPGTLPEFDYVVLHGVYAWVDAAEQQAILALLRQRLRPGGLAFVSYNCLPGWAVEMPLVHLSQRLAALCGGPSVEQAAAVTRALAGFNDAGFRYFAESPGAREAVAAYQQADPDYLAHELLSDGWQPRYVTDVHPALGTAGLRYVGSATLADNHPALLVNDPVQHLIEGLPTPELRTLAMDFALNRRFRRDVFVRVDARSGGVQDDASDPIVVGTLHPAIPSDTPVLVPRGRLRFDPEFLGSVADLVIDRPWPLDELVARLAGAGHHPGEVARNLHFALAAGMLIPFAHSEPSYREPPRTFGTATIERCLRQVAGHEDRTAWVPSSVVGGAVAVPGAEAARVLRALEARQSPARRHGRPGDADLQALLRLQRLGLLQ